MWQSLSNCVPVCSRLGDRHCHPVRTCPRCGNDDETVNHILFECPTATQTWDLALLPAHPGEFPCPPSLYSNFDFILNRVHKRNGSEESLACLPWILWFLLKVRNEKVFNGEEISALDVIQSAKSEAESWRLVQVLPTVLEENAITCIPERPYVPPPRPYCKFDASWKEDDA
ncbi:hypothetical protein Bca52824_033231 [Brassica carinata]|uniref:Reverse transcriptase zinc-binding domain-containing protein n=1 Tax=Brassica carinata TaxID=52824 RepID=A0A8X7SDJ4_BRACI|nr:hypothetical protein Bca52824_033231 [Brassica carinata]